MEYAIIYRPGAAWIRGKLPDQQPLHNHTGYIHDLLLKKKLVQDGPFLADHSKVIVVEVSSEAEARTIFENDPAVRSGIFTGEVTPWNIKFGLHADKSWPAKV